MDNSPIPNYKPKNGEGIIYLYVFDNGKTYVGQTIQELRKRHRGHLLDHQPVDNALRTHQYELKILEIVKINELDDKEREYIRKYNSIKPDGYNLDSGGKANREPTEETRMKQSKARMGKPPWNKGKSFPQASERMKGNTIWKGRSHSQESKDKISKGNTGKKHPDISKQMKGNKRSLGFKHSDEELQRRIETRKKNGYTIKIQCIETGEIFDAISDASKKYGEALNKHLSRAIRTNTKCCGYHWKRI